MEHPQQRTHAEGPTVSQKQIVTVLYPKPGQLAKDVNLVEEVLEINQANLPGPLLLFNNGFQSCGCGAVTSTRVEKKEVDPAGQFP
jgi:hypothetical protein